MDENATLDVPRNALETYALPSDKMYSQSCGDLSYYVNAWQELDLQKYPMMAGTRAWILDEWKKRKELHGLHKSGEIFRQHPDFVSALLTLRFSVDAQQNPHGMIAAIIPGTMEVVWSTPAMQQLQLEGPSFMAENPRMRGAVGLLVLIYRLYAGKLDVSKIPMPTGGGMMDRLAYQPDPTRPKRYFRIRFDNEIYVTKSWSVGMSVDGDLPKLTQKGLDKILANPFDAEHISSIVDTSKFMFNGLGLIWAEEVTPLVQHSDFKDKLSKRDALARRQDLIDLQDELRSSLRVPDLEVGVVLCPSCGERVRARWQPYLRSLRFAEEVDPQSLAPDDFYLGSMERPTVVNALSTEEGTDGMQANGLRSLIVAPLVYHDEHIGFLELASPRPHVFDFHVVPQVHGIIGPIATAIKRVHEGEHERMMAVIKQTCTAIHPSVEWRFQEMARDYLEQVGRDEIPVPSPVVFRQVIPLFGVSDIRGSSTTRNRSIQADLEHQLDLALEVIQTAGQSHPRPVFNELSSRIRRHQKSISKGLKSGDETRIYLFLRHVVESAFDELADLSADIATKVQAYRDELHPDVGVIYQVRRSYDESVTQINDTIGAYLDRQQEVAQRMIPHYFEKFKTDGVDHNIYVGDSLLESGKCSALDLRNLYLWQLMSMCGVVWLMKRLKPTLSTPLDTAHLILLQSSPLNITFQMEEKHFSVDGAYNARYEIVKKRIDKAQIHGTGERLTQPDQIAIVYTQEREFQMYKEFITYLQEEGFLKEEVLDVLLEDLQGVHGLRALRVQVMDEPPDGWDPREARTSLGIV